MLSGAGALRAGRPVGRGEVRELSHATGLSAVEESLGSVRRVTCWGVSGPFLSLACAWRSTVERMISRECGVDVLFVPASLCVLGTHRDRETPG